MKNYGKAAFNAVEKCSKGHSPTEAWESATMEIFGESAAQKKGCPNGGYIKALYANTDRKYHQ